MLIRRDPPKAFQRDVEGTIQNQKNLIEAGQLPQDSCEECYLQAREDGDLFALAKGESAAAGIPPPNKEIDGMTGLRLAVAIPG